MKLVILSAVFVALVCLAVHFGVQEHSSMPAAAPPPSRFHPYKVIHGGKTYDADVIREPSSDCIEFGPYNAKVLTKLCGDYEVWALEEAVQTLRTKADSQ